MLIDLISNALIEQQSNDRLPLNRKLYEAIRLAIINGQLVSGERLASNRELASELGISRNTVVAAIAKLHAEGYLETRVGSGTYISTLANNFKARPSHRLVTTPELSKRGEALALQYPSSHLEIQPVHPYNTDFSSFPIKIWQRLLNKYWRNRHSHMLDYVNEGGYAPLRRAISHYLRASRSLNVEADQIIVTHGTQQSLTLVGMALADPGDTVWMENPAYWGAWKAFTAAGLKIHPVQVDQDGIAPSDADSKSPPTLIYTTPSHQYPTGAVMSLTRRQQLLTLAERHQCWVLEDDYDSEFRFAGPPLSSLAGLDPTGQVIYMGTFSKVLFPGIKLGYLVIPLALVSLFRKIHYDLNRPGLLPIQAALAELIESGHFVTLLKKMRAHYAQRRELLLDTLKPCLSSLVYIGGAEQGLHLCLHLPAWLNDQALCQALANLGVTTSPLSGYSLTTPAIKGLVIGYGYADIDQLRRCGTTIAQLVSNWLSVHETTSTR